jgi:hypothetical protein
MVLFVSLCWVPLHGEELPNSLCPLMPKEKVEGHHVVSLGDVKIYLCCGQCEKLWKKSESAAKYYAKVGLVMGLLPQLSDKEKLLGLDKIDLMEQRFSAADPNLLICPESPYVTYRGKKVYFHSEKGKQSWEKNPDLLFSMAMSAGILPQFNGNTEASSQ